MTKSQIGAICPICTMEYEPGDEVEVFGCHPTHMLHVECLHQLKKDAFKKKKPITCPICRKTVNGELIVKKRLLAAETQVETYDPFAVGVLPPDAKTID